MKPRPRTIVGPDGTPHICTRVPRAYLRDVYVHLLTASWMKFFITLTAAFLVVTLLFAAGYDLDGGVRNARPGSIIDAFFFSIQTIATIGVREHAPHSTLANSLFSLEALVGLVGFALVTGLTFARFLVLRRA